MGICADGIFAVCAFSFSCCWGGVGGGIDGFVAFACFTGGVGGAVVCLDFDDELLCFHCCFLLGGGFREVFPFVCEELAYGFTCEPVGFVTVWAFGADSLVLFVAGIAIETFGIVPLLAFTFDA